MQYPHWLMVAGGLLVILGFAGLAFRKSSPEPAEEDAPPEARPQLRPWLAKRPEESQEMGVDRPKVEGKQMGETRGSRWTPKEDNLFRKMVQANIDPEIIAAKLNRPIHNLRARAYTIGLPLKWFRLKAKGK